MKHWHLDHNTLKEPTSSNPLCNAKSLWAMGYSYHS